MTLSVCLSLEWSDTNRGIEVGTVGWSRGAISMLISRNINREGITRIQRGSDKGTREERLLACVPNRFPVSSTSGDLDSIPAFGFQ